MTKLAKKIKKAISNPRKALIYLLNQEIIAGIFSDRLYLKIKFRLIMRKSLNLTNPQTFSEKLQWLKIYDRKIEYTKMVDKYEVRKYIAEKLGEEYLIPLLGVWDNPDDIDFDSLPERFVLKCTHNSGLGMCICKDKSKLDIKTVKKELRKGLKQDYFVTSREWPYKNVKPRIVAEKYMEDAISADKGLVDYKVLCFNGKAQFIEVHSDRFGQKHTQDFYDREWNKTEISQQGTCSDFVLEKPICFDECIRLSEILAAGMRHVRTDWYIINGKLYFGEITFFDGSGFYPFDRQDDDLYFGSFINLEEQN